MPNNDRVPEGIETLVATLSHCGPGSDPPTGVTCFEGFDIDPAHQSATVFIRDDGITETSLAITRPQDGVFDAIMIKVVAAVPLFQSGDYFGVSWRRGLVASILGNAASYFIGVIGSHTPWLTHEIGGLE